MFDPLTSVRISLGSVLLDRPDHSGEYIAQDMAGGWAYAISDADGDLIARGQGVCAGGLDAALRQAFLTSANHITDCGNIGILVDSRRAHHAMVRLATNDLGVVAAIAGRPVAIMTRPKARSSAQVRAVAERIASGALRDREHAESSAADMAASTLQNERDMAAMLVRRARQAAEVRAQPITPAEPIVPVRSAEVLSFVRPAGSETRRPDLSEWLRDIDGHVATIRADLRDVGA